MENKLQTYFRAEAREILDKLSLDILSFEKQPSADLMSRMLRLAHTLKGAARVAKQKEIANSIHQFEEILSPHRDKPASFPQSAVDELLKLLDQIGDQLAQQREQLAQPSLADSPAKPSQAKAVKTLAQVEEALPLGLLGSQSLEVEGLMEDLSAATGQVEALKRNLQIVERGKTLGELLVAQLSTEGMPRAIRLVAEELQTQMRGVERNLAFGLDQLDRELQQVRESTEKLRLVRAGALVPTLRRILRDDASAQGLQAELLVTGADLRLEPSLLAAVQGALIQALRNCVAHGIEPPEERVLAGKAAKATVTLEITREGRLACFRCHDDGRGIDLKAVRRRLSEKGVPSGGLDQEALLRALLASGVSTAGRVSQAAGRGIGLDVIRQTAAELGGEVHLKTETGQFTEISLQIPWTVAGMNFLEISGNALGQEATNSMLVPLDSVKTAIRLDPSEISRQSDGDTILHEGQGIPLLSLDNLLGLNNSNGLAAVVIGCSKGLMALSAGSLRGIRVASLLPLPEFTKSAGFLAGAALDADGDAQLVLDPEGLLAEASKSRDPLSQSIRTGGTLLVIDDSLTTRMLQQSILESAGYQVELASSAEEGLEKLRIGSYRLILVDVEMPGIDGFTFVERIRSNPDLKEIPAILVTSRDAPEDKWRGKAVGAQGYMVKSEFDQNHLLEQIRSLLA